MLSALRRARIRLDFKDLEDVVVRGEGNRGKCD